MTIAAVAGVEPHEAGLASGLINTRQQVGGALGLAILAAVANSRTRLGGRGGQLAAGRADRGLPDGADGRRRVRDRRRAARATCSSTAARSRRTSTATWCRSRRSQEGAPDGDLQRAGLDPQLSSPGSRRMPEAAQAASARSPPSRVSYQARRVPAERAEAGVLPVVPQRAVGPVEHVVEVRVAVQRLDRGAQRRRASACRSSIRSQQRGRGLAVERLLGGELAPAAPRPRSRRRAPAASRGSSRSASWQSRSASPAATGSTGSPVAGT